MSVPLARTIVRRLYPPKRYARALYAPTELTSRRDSIPALISDVRLCSAVTNKTRGCPCLPEDFSRSTSCWRSLMRRIASVSASVMLSCCHTVIPLSYPQT
uniref:Hypothetical membrane protein n=1 Tax=uncultured virus TaxID=340016 RepID=D5L2C0_9VIRU|nr:hypothetical membrane protein [uncultured virus]